MTRKRKPAPTPALAVPPELAPVAEKLAPYLGGRRSAEEALKALLALGCRIQPPESSGSTSLQAWQDKGEDLRRSGGTLQAYDHLRQGLDRWPRDLRLRQLFALALADCGATKRANRVAVSLRHEGHGDEETLGILARTYKDLWLQDPALGNLHLEKARETYMESFTRSRGYYAGINAATLARILGKRAEAERIARKVEVLCREALSGRKEGGSPFYLYATLGEAALVQGRLHEAEKWYAESAAAGRGLWRDLQSTRKNARLLIRSLGLDGRRIEELLATPAVAVFTAAANRRLRANGPWWTPMASDKEEALGRALEERLGQEGVGFGYTTVLGNAEWVFVEKLLEQGAEICVVLPYKRAYFIKEAFKAPGTSREKRRSGLLEDLEKRGAVTCASDWPIGTRTDSCRYALRMLEGLACLEARRLDTAFKHWAWREEAQGRPCRLEEVESERFLALGDSSKDLGTFGTGGTGDFSAVLRSILFADVVRYSHLQEGHVPPFVEQFMGRVAALAQRSPHAPEVRDVWGDALYFAFARIRDAGLFALELVDLVTRTPWENMGLPPGLNLRVALHAGPVYGCLHPIIRQHTYTGTHVSRAARIEPITPPGLVYATEAFAALAASERISEFQCEYVGQIAYAKDYGAYPTYHVRR